MRFPSSVVGASGGLMALVGYIFVKFPSTNFKLIFLPDSFSFTAKNLLIGMLTFELGFTVASILTGRIFLPIAHRAHLSGLLCGAAYGSYHKTQNVYTRPRY